MKINFKQANFEMTPAIKNYLEKKIGALDKFTVPDNDNTILEIEIGKSVSGQMSGEIFRTEFNLTINGRLYRAEAKAFDSYASIDEVIDGLLRQIKKSRKKKFDLLKKGGRRLKRMIRRRLGKE